MLGTVLGIVVWDYKVCARVCDVKPASMRELGRESPRKVLVFIFIPSPASRVEYRADIQTVNIRRPSPSSLCYPLPKPLLYDKLSN